MAKSRIDDVEQRYGSQSFRGFHTSIAVTADGQFIAGAGGYCFRVFAQSGELVQYYNWRYTRTVESHPTKPMLVIGRRDGSFSVVDLVSGNAIETTISDPGAVDVKFSACGTMLLTCSTAEDRARLWHFPELTPLSDFQDVFQIGAIVGKFCLAINFMDEIVCFPIDGSADPEVMKCNPMVNGLSRIDDRHFAVAGKDGCVQGQRALWGVLAIWDGLRQGC